MKNLIGLLGITLLLSSAYGDSLSGLQDSVGTRPSDDSVRVIGNLPYSNQWVFERPSNYLYLNFDRVRLANQDLMASNFQTHYPSADLNLLSVDFYSRLLTLADPLGTSFLGRFSLWGRYRLGFGLAQGSLEDTQAPTDLSSEKNSLMVVAGQLGLQLSYDLKDWFQPFVGFNYMPYYFRNSSSMSSADLEGQGALYGPSVGFHLPVLFSHKGSLSGEVRQLLSSSSSGLLGSSLGADFGVGLVF